MSRRKATELESEARRFALLHLAMAERTAARLQAVLRGKASIFRDLPDQPPFKPEKSLGVQQLQFLEDEFRDLVGDAMAARIYLRELTVLAKAGSRRRSSESRSSGSSPSSARRKRA